MGRRKKKTWRGQLGFWVKAHRNISVALGLLIILLLYFPLHGLATYRDRLKFKETQTAMSETYANISTRLGQPENVKSVSRCTTQSALLRSQLTCRVETDFVYSVANRSQADTLISQIQKAIASSRSFKATRKLSPSLSDSLVFETVYHDALDYYSGPHHIACTVKYSFDTPDELTLSLTQPGKALEVFFACSARVSRAVYPLANA